MKKIIKNKHFIIFFLLLTFTLTLNVNILEAQEEQPQKRNFCIAKRGDSLWRISKKHNVKFSRVLRINDHFENRDMIYPGNRVYMPPNVETDTPPIKEELTPPEEPMEKETTPEEQPVKTNNAAAFESKVVQLVNAERKKIGLKPYSHNQKLSQVARTKSKDMRDKNYFSHQSPTYGSPFEMMKQFNIQYKAAGENIAKGQRTPKEVVKAWMNSPGHRRNILSQQFTEIGVGFAQNDNGETFWTQMFIRP